jgi:hypothetical protein
MPNGGQTQEGQGSIESLMRMLDQRVTGERPYATAIKQEVFVSIASSAGWRKVDDGYFLSGAGTHIFINKIAKDPRTGLPLINPATNKEMIPDLVIVTKTGITVIDHVWQGSPRHLQKTQGYAEALERAWRLPVTYWADFDIARKFKEQERLARTRQVELTANSLWRESRRQSQQQRFQLTRAASRRSVFAASKVTSAGRWGALFLLGLEVAKLVVQGFEAFKSPDMGSARVAGDFRASLRQLQKSEEEEGRVLVPVLKTKAQPDDFLYADTRDPFELNERRVAEFESMFWWEFVSVEGTDYAERAKHALTTRLSASVIANNLFPRLAASLECPFPDGSLEALQWATDKIDILRTFRALSEEASKEYLALISRARAH